jgi:hypothetical protein
VTCCASHSSEHLPLLWWWSDQSSTWASGLRGDCSNAVFSVPLQSLMERALAGQFDRSLKFGHSSGIWQVNDKGWEDDHDHIDFDVSHLSICVFCTLARSSFYLRIIARRCLCI